MNHPGSIRISAFDYELPADRIAGYPKKDRSSSRLLVYEKEHIREDVFSHIPSYIPPGSLMVFNDTRVVEARLLFRKPTGAAIEIFCLAPYSAQGNIAGAFASHHEVTWKCLVGNASSWSAGLVLEKEIGEGYILRASMLHKENDDFVIRLSWTNEQLSFAEVLHQAGVMPLPPYIRRKAEAGDADWYQTVYSRQPGSVAAPTAGLHFTGDILEQLRLRGTDTDFVTLHVGAGTFKPVKSDTLQDHTMHAEYIEVKRTFLKKIIDPSGLLIAVGTTSLRTLESLYWLGVKLLREERQENGEWHIGQWEPYGNGTEPTRQKALETVLEYLEKNGMDTLVCETSLLIAPPYRFRIADGLVTNFHQPRSTLLLLVAAFIGDSWKSVYTYALDNGFRFLSYGDACLLFRR